MFQIKIICIGKTNEAWISEGLDKYLKLLGKYAKIEWIELPDVKSGNKMDAARLKEAESILIQKQLSDKATVVFLDEKGKKHDSESFAAIIDKIQNQSGKCVFIIGGSYGLEETLKRKGELISLSAMTFNHQMVRVILAEQLFRAFTILKGTGYHH